MNYVKLLKTAFILSVLFCLICGFLYPLFMTLTAQLVFPRQAAGSLIYIDGKAVGSKLLGQDFTDPRFLRGRPSAVGYNTYTAEEKENGDYAGIASGSANYAPSNPLLSERVSADTANFLKKNPSVKIEHIPADLFTASGSGLDPHLTPESAALQLPAIAAQTGISETELRAMVKKHTKNKVFGLFGEKTVNVLLVNLAIARTLGIING